MIRKPTAETIPEVLWKNESYLTTLLMADLKFSQYIGKINESIFAFTKASSSSTSLFFYVTSI